MFERVCGYAFVCIVFYVCMYTCQVRVCPIDILIDGANVRFYNVGPDCQGDGLKYTQVCVPICVSLCSQVCVPICVSLCLHFCIFTSRQRLLHACVYIHTHIHTYIHTDPQSSHVVHLPPNASFISHALPPFYGKYKNEPRGA